MPIGNDEIYLIEVTGGFLQKHDAMNFVTKDPESATRFYGREAAEVGRPGHSKDMGGKGFSGKLVKLSTVRSYRRKV